MLSFPVKYRRRRKLPEQSSPPPLPPAGVTVVSVAQEDDQIALWTFSAPVISVEDYSGLTIANQEPDSLIEIMPSGQLRLSYSSGVSGDDPWEASDSIPIALTFEGGGTLQVPESGTVG
jgi:hypothetical protein